MTESDPQPTENKTLDPSKLDAVMEIIQSLNGGIINIHRYPPGSAVMEMALKRGMEALDNVLTNADTIDLGGSDGKLIVDGAILDERTQKKGIVVAFVQILDQKNLRSITMRKGVTQKEVLKFLDILGRKEEEIRELGNLNDYLKSQDIMTIALDEKVYVALTQEQAIIDKAELERMMESGGNVDAGRIRQGVFAEYLLKKLKLPGLEVSPETLKNMKRKDFASLAEKIADAMEANAQSGIQQQNGKTLDADGQAIEEGVDPATHALMKNFEKISQSIVKLPNEAVRNKVMTDLTKIISSFKSSTLAKILSTRMTGDSSKLNLKGYLLAQASANKKSEVVDQLLERYNKALDGLSPEDFNIRFSDLKESERVLSALLNRQKQANAPDMPAETVDKLQKALSLVTRLGKEGGSPENLLILKTKKLLSQPPEFFNQPAVQDNLPGLVKRLLAMHRLDVVKTILDKYGANLGSQEVDIRRGALGGLLKLNTSLLDSEYSMLVQETVQQISGALKNETDPENQKLAYSSVALSIAGLVTERKYPMLESLLENMRQAEGTDDSDALRHILKEACNNEEAMNVLLEDFQSGDEAVSGQAMKILAGMDPETVLPRFIDVLRTSESRKERKQSVDTIVNFGKPVLGHLCMELKKDGEELPWFLARNLIGAIGEIGGAEALDDLLLQALHPESRVRRAVYQAIMPLEDPKARKALADALDDEDITNKRAIIAYFGMRREAAIVDDLVEILEQQAEGQYDLLIADICTALGRIGDQKTVAPLMKIAKPGGLKNLFKKKNPKMLEASIKALGELKATEAEGMLKKYSADSNPAIARAAQEALRKIGT